MKVLLVEDDEFKATDLIKIMEETLFNGETSRASSVTSACKAITNEVFDVVILDMSLPTFDLSGPGGGGSPQSQGGLEILRLARRLKYGAGFIILTQYPDIEIDGKDVELVNAARILSGKFRATVTKCLAYDFSGDSWREPFRSELISFADRWAKKSGVAG